jgi:hypothetical protein
LTNGLRICLLLIGTLERLFFTLIIAFDVTAAAVAMVAWLALKMATNWNRPNASHTPTEALTGLLGGLISMLFALIGGLICKGDRVVIFAISIWRFD